MEVGSSLVVLGATWGTLEFYPYNRDEAITSFLLGMLLALYKVYPYCLHV